MPRPIPKFNVPSRHWIPPCRCPTQSPNSSSMFPRVIGSHVEAPPNPQIQVQCSLASLDPHVNAPPNPQIQVQCSLASLDPHVNAPPNPQIQIQCSLESLDPQMLGCVGTTMVSYCIKQHEDSVTSYCIN